MVAFCDVDQQLCFFCKLNALQGRQVISGSSCDSEIIQELRFQLVGAVGIGLDVRVPW